MTIVLADNLHRALSDLDGSARRRVVDFLIKLQTEPQSSGVRLKSLVFVACTRPRETLRVSWHGKPSLVISPLIMLFPAKAARPETVIR